jgi:GTPase involved in cell partitioning and DNA repair
MEIEFLKHAIEEKILQNIPAEIDKKFLSFLEDYKNFFNAIDENNLSLIEIELKFYTPNRTFDTRLLIYSKNSVEAEINISSYKLKDFAPSVKVVISAHTYEEIEHKIKDFDKFLIGKGEINYTGTTYYIYIIQKLISLNELFIMEYFL